MKAVEYIQIEGRKYPMVFSLGATEQLTEKYESMQGFQKALQSANMSITAFLDVLEILIGQGCEYMNTFGYDLPEYPEEGFTPITRKELSACIDFEDLPEISQKVLNCLTASRQTSIQAKPRKNLKAVPNPKT